MKHLIPIIVLSSFLLLTGCGSSDCMSCLWAGETPAPTTQPEPTTQSEPTTQPEQPVKTTIIRGVVRRGDTPIKNARVTLNTKAPIETLTDSEGKFEITGVKAGDYTLTVKKAHHRLCKKEIHLADFKEVSATLDEADVECELTKVRILFGGSGEDLSPHRGAPKILSDGSILFLAYSESKDGDLDESDGRGWWLHLDRDGELISSKRYDLLHYYSIGYGSFCNEISFFEEAKDHTIVAISEAISEDTSQDPKLNNAIVAHIPIDGDEPSIEVLGGSNDDRLYCMTKAADGTFWACGASRSSDIDKNTAKHTTVPEDQLKNHGGAQGWNDWSGWDGWLVHLDQNGKVISNMLLGGSANEQLSWIKSAPDGTIWAFGTSGSTDGDITTGNLGQNGCVWIVHLDSSGKILSSYRHGNNMYASLHSSLAIAPDSSLWYAGAENKGNGELQNAGGYGDNDGWLLHIGTKDGKDGQLLSSQLYGGSLHDYFTEIALAPDGTIWLLGKSKSTDGELQDVPEYGSENENWIMHIDPTKPYGEKGHILSSRRYGGSSYNNISGLRVASDSSIWVAGNSGSKDGDFENIPDIPAGNNGWLMHLGRNGEILTNKLYGGSGGEWFYGITEIQNDMVWLYGGASYEGITPDGDFEGETYHGGMYDAWAMQVDLKDIK